MSEAVRLARLSRWFAAMRLVAVPFAISQIVTAEMPPGYDRWAWITCAVLVVGALVLFALSRVHLDLGLRRKLALAALAFDTALVFAFVLLFSYENGQPVWALFYLPILEAGLRFGIVGGIVMPLVVGPMIAAAEAFRSARFDPSEFRLDVIAIRGGLGLIIGAVVGRLVEALVEQGRLADARAEEAEALRDRLARRVDALEGANRCARALGSSLQLDHAFTAFIRELRGLIRFDRLAIVLADDDVARVMAVAGGSADTLYPPGATMPLSNLDALAGQTVYREDMSDGLLASEAGLVEAGLRARVSAPLLVSAKPIGALSLSRVDASSFTPDEIELVSLLGRLVATAVQNIRAYEAEHRTVEELRRLSALRADFVSLVSHELRSPMAAVIGAARTLQERWRELAPEQRESFLALIGDETTRLAALIGDVLDTSRIEAGTFSYTFDEVDVGALIRETAETVRVGQDEVHVSTTLPTGLPQVRGDRARLRQVLTNLIENAVKYSAAGDEVQVQAAAANGRVEVSVRDNGPGIAAEHQRLIFEKFGRAKAGRAGKPGTGLGLFIARSIAEAHGGSIEVRSTPGRGATFTVALPVEGP